MQVDNTHFFFFLANQETVTPWKKGAERAMDHHISSFCVACYLWRPNDGSGSRLFSNRKKRACHHHHQEGGHKTDLLSPWASSSSYKQPPHTQKKKIRPRESQKQQHPSQAASRRVPPQSPSRNPSRFRGAPELETRNVSVNEVHKRTHTRTRSSPAARPPPQNRKGKSPKNFLAPFRFRGTARQNKKEKKKNG
jgi:hypothetical protein